MRAPSAALLGLALLAVSSLNAGDAQPAKDPLDALNVDLKPPEWSELKPKDEGASLDVLLERPLLPQIGLPAMPELVLNSWAQVEDVRIDRCRQELRSHFRTFARTQARHPHQTKELLEEMFPLAGHFVHVPGDHTVRTLSVLAFCKCKSHENKGRCVLYSDGNVDWTADTEQLKKNVERTLKLFHRDLALTEKFTRRDLEQAVLDLGHDDFDKREQASALLARGGRQSLALLQQGEQSKDKEIAHRCKQIVQRITNLRLSVIREELNVRDDEF